MKELLGGLPKRACLIGLSVLLVLAVTVAALGCGTDSEVGDGGAVSTTAPSETTTTSEPPEETTTTTPADTTTTSSTAPEDTMTIRVYFSRDEKICAASRVIPKTQQVGAAAMKALLEGPTEVEKQAGMVSNIPEGTTFLGLDIEDGIATVDLSKEYSSGGGSLSMMMRLAEVVFTLTQFPTVDGVNFKLDGEPIDVLGGEGIIIDHPMSRVDYEDMSPAILVESPTVGNTISSPVRITGTANVFEAVFRINIVDYDGLILADEVVMATSGTGTRGTFDVTIPFNLRKPGPGWIIAFSESPKDGSQINIVEIPVELE
ncbi:MAG: GerMN domain-containing protein [Actinomycetia bacterium]|nr:GerMN domain-containing protein [Actinomycetes bacterium]